MHAIILHGSRDVLDGIIFCTDYAFPFLSLETSIPKRQLSGRERSFLVFRVFPLSNFLKPRFLSGNYPVARDLVLCRNSICVVRTCTLKRTLPDRDVVLVRR